MTRLTVHEYAAGLRPRYRTATKGAKKRILDQFCQTTGMHRKAALRLLQPGPDRIVELHRGHCAPAPVRREGGSSSIQA